MCLTGKGTDEKLGTQSLEVVGIIAKGTDEKLGTQSLEVVV